MSKMDLDFEDAYEITQQGRLASLYTALSEAQQEIEPPVKDKTGQFNNKYASLDAIYECCRIPLANHGLTIQQEVAEKDGNWTLLTILSHCNGATVPHSMPVIVEKNGCQGFVSALTYARRAAVTSLLCLPQDEDDDGDRAMNLPKMQTVQSKPNKLTMTLTTPQTKHLMESIGGDLEILERIMKKYDLEKISDLHQSKLKEVLDGVKEIKEKKACNS